MKRADKHTKTPDVSFNGGALDCGNGLLLLIRRHIDPLDRGGLLEILSREISVDEDLPAWCRLTGNELVSWTKEGKQRSFLVCKGKLGERDKTQEKTPPAARRPPAMPASKGEATPLTRRAEKIPAPAIPAPAVMGLGSWPRPRWMAGAMHAYREGRIDEATFQDTADDAIRLAVAAQVKAGWTS